MPFVHVLIRWRPCSKYFWFWNSLAAWVFVSSCSCFSRVHLHGVFALVSCSFMRFFSSILCNKPVHLSSFSVYGNLSPKTLNYQLHHNYGSRTDIYSLDSTLLVSWSRWDNLNAKCGCLQTTLENCRICIERFLNCRTIPRLNSVQDTHVLESRSKAFDLKMQNLHSYSQGV